MIDIVNELIEIEGIANEILVSGENDKLISKQVYDLLCKELDKKIDELAQIEIEQMQKAGSFLKDERLSQVSANYKEFALQMQNEFDLQKDNWISDIFDDLLED